MHITTEIYQDILLAMTAIAAVVFVALFFVNAGYGLFSSSKWGPSLSNRAAWVFVWWTFANLAPRANAIHKRYHAEFGKNAVGKRKRLIPFIW